MVDPLPGPLHWYVDSAHVPAPTCCTTPVVKAISLVLIEDNPSARKGVVARIRAQPGFRVLATSAELEVALRKVRETKPDLVLLNLGWEGDGSLMLAGALHGVVPESRVIMMGLDRLYADVASFVRAGVSGFIMADASFDRFLSTIHSVARGIQVLPLELTGSLFGQLNGYSVRRRPRRTPGGKRPANRERAVTELIVQGESNRAIAARLGIALHTAKRHVHQVLSKLTVNSRLEVAAFSQSGAGVPSSPF